jgi:hypothetical protein
VTLKAHRQTISILAPDRRRSAFDVWSQIMADVVAYRCTARPTCNNNVTGMGLLALAWDSSNGRYPEQDQVRSNSNLIRRTVPFTIVCSSHYGEQRQNPPRLSRLE